MNLNLYDNYFYNEDIRKVISVHYPWDKLRNRSLMLSGATGLIGSFLVDVILEKNLSDGLNCTIYALGRNEAKARARFNKFANDPHFVFLPFNVKLPLKRDDIGTVDYVLHLASNTHPMLYATDPIGTIMTNIIGVQNLLDFSVEHKATRFVFASSNEIYGENRGDIEFFDENYCGYIDCNTLRAAYPESKRCGEALCQAYKSQKGLDVIIARFTRSYGPTMEMSNTRALSPFIKKAIEGEDIVLKSAGTQLFSYTYMADAVSGVLCAMLNGKSGEAYNIADESGDIMLKDLAALIAEIGGKKVVFEDPDVVEAAGYSKVTKARLDGTKLKELGWKPAYDIKKGMERTISILKLEKEAILMKNYVILLAGGVGKRMGGDLPKQFMKVDGKPIIVYTIERFQKNPQIEKILVVCVKDWIDHLKGLIEKYSLSKVKWITEGGETGHDSIRNGVFFLRDKIEPGDFIIVHDAVRPILPQKTIDEVLRVAHEYGNASSSIACHPPIVYTEDFKSGITDVDREHVMLTASPQAYRYSLALKCYEKAEEENKHNFTFTSSLLIHYGERVYFAKGTTSNIKITQKEDLALFEAILKVSEELLYS